MKPDEEVVSNQETSMLAQDFVHGQDEFQVEAMRVRNSLNALAMKKFMLDEDLMASEEYEAIDVAKQPVLEGKAVKKSAPAGKDAKKSVPVIKPSKFPQKSLQVTRKPAVAGNVAKNPTPVVKLPRQLPSTVKVEQKTTKVTTKPVATPELPVASRAELSTSDVPFKRSLSKHRIDSSRVESKKIDSSDIVAALALTQSEETSKSTRVRFTEISEPSREPEAKKIVQEPSRDSNEVASLNNELPWHKKHEYRTVTPFFKAKNKTKAMSSENVSTISAFRPIETSLSTEDMQKEIVKPIPVFASSISYQELPTRKHDTFDEFRTKSIDNLLSDNIDGCRKPESKRHRLMRMRSTSSTNLNRLSDQIVYENFHYDVNNPPESTAHLRKKFPLPLPRASNENLRQSKTIVYVLDKSRDEFILEGSKDDEKVYEEVYEEVLMRNNVDRFSDSSLFSSLVDSNLDCKF